MKQASTEQRSWTTWQANEAEQEEAFQVLSERAGVPKRYLSARWSSLKIVNSDQRTAIRGILNYAKSFPDMLDKGISMCWLGRPGSGKTMLASILAMHVIRSGYTVRVFDWCDIIYDLKESDRYDADRKRKDIYADLLDPDLLIIDEIDVDVEKRSQKEIQRIINKRYNEVLPTILIGNLTSSELQEAVGDRVVSRISQDGGGIVVFSWQSLR